MKTNRSLRSTILLTILFILLIAIAAGCGDSSVTGTEVNNNTNSNTSMSVLADNNANDNPAEIVITEAKALITEVELETEPSGTSQNIRVEPFVIHFTAGGMISNVVSGNLPEGTFSKIKFKIHKPEDNESIPDAEFREGSSGNQRYSFIIKGTYNGNSFVFKSRRSVNMLFSLPVPVVTGSNSRNITLVVNPGNWFANGSETIDPRNPSNENIIEDNIKNSFKRAFKDDDRNGLPDDN